MKEFNEKNITRRSNLSDNDSISCYMGHGAQQNPNAYEVFYNFLSSIKPKRILEIGTGMGGFTYFLRLACNDLELDAKILTYDVHRTQMFETLRMGNIDVRTESIFTSDNSNITPDAINFINGDGITVVLCDGGNKVNEFQMISKYLRPGDFIMAHDYASSNEYFKKNVFMQLWNWCEIQDSDIEAVSVKHNLLPYNQEIFQKAVWVCRKKF